MAAAGVDCLYFAETRGAIMAGCATQGFFDARTGTVSYVVHDPATRRAAVIDPVLDFDAKSGRTSTASADALIRHVDDHALGVDWILETHVHADHLSAAQYLKARVGGRVATGEHVRDVQDRFARLFDFGPGFVADGAAFDHLFADGERFAIGGIDAVALWVPGHTPMDMAYRMGECVFVGDTLFMPDVGSARADFPGGDARALYRSVRRILELPPSTDVYVCHDYPPTTRKASWRSTVAEQRASNVHVRDGVDEAAFVAMRTARDATLDVPALMLPAIQVNVHAGRLPAAGANGVAYLRIPLDALPVRA
jgi:glyoxylase-like metal-dependent hydrolase (beta-lactamase superfamily II)